MELQVSKYIDIHFTEKGRGMAGCDCWGLVFLIYRDLLDTELPLYLDSYQNTADEKVVSAAIRNEKVNWEEVDKAQPGNVVLIRLKGQPMHVGVYLGNGRFIHCLDKVGVVIEKVNSITWRDRIVGYYKYSG